jgi:nitroreductase
MDVITAIRARATVKQFSGAPLASEAVAELLELAVWAPNHGLTEPWRFAAVADEAARRALAERVDAAYLALDRPADDAAAARLARKRDDMRRRIEQAGALVFVTQAREPGASAEQEREDYAACAAAIQSLLLAATARGIASYWSTGKPLRAGGVRAFLGLGDEASAAFVGCVFLGTAAPAPPGAGTRERTRTPARELTRFVGPSGADAPR